MIKPGCMPTSRKGLEEIFGDSGMGERALMRAALSCAVLVYRPPENDTRYPKLDKQDVVVPMDIAQVLANEAHGEAPKPKRGHTFDEPDAELFDFYDTARSICNVVIFRNGMLIKPDLSTQKKPKKPLPLPPDSRFERYGGQLIVCPKFRRAVDFLINKLGENPSDEKRVRAKTVFFTHWTNEHGVATLRLLLEEANIPFGEISGLVKSFAKRNDFIKRYNDDTLHVLILSEAGNEGLNLKGTRFFHVLEPQWNSTSEDQAIARAVRLKSHAHLNQNERHVQVFRYLCVMPGYGNNPELGRRATFPRDSEDTFMRDLCIRKDRINGPFERLVWAVARRNESRCFEALDG